jgi:NurA-like 5'-3' nuclease
MDIIIQNPNVDKLIDETKAKCSTYFDINILLQDTASTALFFANVAYYISGIPPYSNKKIREGLTEEKKLKMLKEINSIFEKYLADKESFSEIMNYITAFYVSLADNEQAVFLKITNKKIKKIIEAG